MQFSRRTLLIASAILVAAFAALYPVLDCGEGGCPEATHAASAMSACLAVVLIAFPAALVRPERRAAWPGRERVMSSQADRTPEPRPPQTFR